MHWCGGNWTCPFVLCPDLQPLQKSWGENMSSKTCKTFTNGSNFIGVETFHIPLCTFRIYSYCKQYLWYIGFTFLILFEKLGKFLVLQFKFYWAFFLKFIMVHYGLPLCMQLVVWLDPYSHQWQIQILFLLEPQLDLMLSF